MLFSIERATKQPIEPMDLPSIADINKSRVDRFKANILATISDENLDFFSQIIVELQQDKEVSSEQIAAAAAFLAQGDTSLVLDEAAMAREAKSTHSSAGFDRDDRERGRSRRGDRGDRRERSRDDKPVPSKNATSLKDYPEVKMQRFRLDVGRRNQVKPGNIVGAIANEAELESKYIGEIEIRDGYSTVDLPADMPKEVMSILKRARVAGRPLDISIFDGKAPASGSGERAAPKKKSYTSKKRDRGAPRDGKSKGPNSDYAQRKNKERKTKERKKS